MQRGDAIRLLISRSISKVTTFKISGKPSKIGKHENERGQAQFVVS